MPMPTALERYCDEYWETTSIDEFLDCVAGKLAEELQRDAPLASYEDLTSQMHVFGDGPLTEKLRELKHTLVQKLEDHLD